MNKRQWTWYWIAVVILLGTVVGLSVLTGKIILSLIAVVIGMLFLFLGSRRVEEITVDERTHKISEKAASTTFRIFLPVIAMIGLVLILLRNRYPDTEELGFVLSSLACGLLAIYLVFYGYYSKKYGV